MRLSYPLNKEGIRRELQELKSPAERERYLQDFLEYLFQIYPDIDELSKEKDWRLNRVAMTAEEAQKIFYVELYEFTNAALKNPNLYLKRIDDSLELEQNSNESVDESKSLPTKRRMIQWLRDEPLLTFMVEKLILRECIPNQNVKELLSNHFAWDGKQFLIDSTETGTDMIHWQDSQVDLAALVNALLSYECKALSEFRINQRISEHFLWKDKSDSFATITAKNLKTVRYQTRSRVDREPSAKMMSIILDLKNKFRR